MKNSIYKNPAAIEFLSWAFLFSLIALPAFYYGQLPEEIPSHFNGLGEADAYSGKGSLWVLPIIGTALFGFLSFLGTDKKLRVNYPRAVSNPAEEAQQRLIGRKLIYALRLILPAAFLYITYRTIKMGMGEATGLGVYFLPVFLMVIFGTIAYYFFQMSKKPEIRNPVSEKTDANRDRGE